MSFRDVPLLLLSVVAILFSGAGQNFGKKNYGEHSREII